MARVTLSGQLFTTQPTENILWLELTAGVTHSATDLAGILTAMSAAWASDMSPIISSSWVLTNLAASWIYSPGNSVEANVAATHAGALGVAPENAATCYVVDWLIGRYYRGGHPRSYFAGVGESIIINGSQIESAYVASVGAAAASFLAGVNAATSGGITAVALGTVSFANANAWRAPPVFEAYTGAKCRTYLGTQKRRIGGR